METKQMAFKELINEINDLITDYEKVAGVYDGKQEKNEDELIEGFDLQEEPPILGEIDNFFLGRENNEQVIEILVRYKKVLRKRIKNFNIEELENFYHHTMYNTISSQIILERYDVIMKKKMLGLNLEDVRNLKSKVLNESKTYKKIFKMLS